jgi:hypothetical protein
VQVAAGLVGLAILCAVAPVSPRAVERLYSQGVYSAIQPTLTSASNRLPLSLLDLLILLAFGGWLLLAGRDLRRASAVGWPRTVGRIALRTVAWSAAAYLVFLATWGFNYRRVRLIEKLAFSADQVTSDAALALATLAVEQLNQLDGPAHDAGWGAADAIDLALAEAFNRAVRDAVTDHPVVAGRPKR